MHRVYLLNDAHIFPSAKKASPEGLLAVGGDMHPSRVLKAYTQGIFPWYSEGDPIMWWSPDPRMIVVPNQFQPSKSLKRLMRNGQYNVVFDQDFKLVMDSCANTRRKGQEGTWITDDYRRSFTLLHEAGLAHSAEVYRNDQLVGGLYGLSLGKVFFGESMFHAEANTSKIAFAFLVQFMLEQQMTLIDAQQETDHLKNLGGFAVDRSLFLEILHEALGYPTLTGNWGKGDAKLDYINPDKIFEHIANERS